MFDVTGTFLDELQDWFAKNYPDTETFILEIENSQGDGVPITERGNVQRRRPPRADQGRGGRGDHRPRALRELHPGRRRDRDQLETQYGVPAVAVHNGAFRSSPSDGAHHGMPYLRQAYTPSPVVNLTGPELARLHRGRRPGERPAVHGRRHRRASPRT